MFDDDDGVACITQFVQHFEQQGNVGKVQPCGGFVQYVERFARIGARKLLREFYALRFAAREGGGALPQPDVAQAHVEQGLQLAGNGWLGAHKGIGFFYRHIEYLRDVFSFVEHFKCFAVVAQAVADVARHIHIGQKVHFYFDQAITLAGFAAPAARALRDVERKAPRAVTALFCHGHIGHQVADVGKQPRVGGRVAARGAPDGALVYVDDFVEICV